MYDFKFSTVDFFNSGSFDFFKYLCYQIPDLALWNTVELGLNNVCSQSKSNCRFYSKVLRLTDPTKIPQVCMQIVMNVAVGGRFPGPPDEATAFPTHFLIDNIVVRQRNADNESGQCRTDVVVNEAPLAKFEEPLPLYVYTLVGGLSGLVLLVVTVWMGIIYWKKQRARMGTMTRNTRTSRRTNSINGIGGSFVDTILASLLDLHTGDVSYDWLLKKYVSLIEIPAKNLQLSKSFFSIIIFSIIFLFFSCKIGFYLQVIQCLAKVNLG